MIYSIRIRQDVPNGMHSEFTEHYDSIETLKKAFEFMNSQVMFGELEKENITPCWETDTYSEVIRRMGNCTTTITTLTVFPRTMKHLKLEGAFAMERSLYFLRTFH